MAPNELTTMQAFIVVTAWFAIGVPIMGCLLGALCRWGEGPGGKHDH